jgi:hypothetical protein
VRDEQGGVIPGATVVLISEARGTKSAPAVTNETGDFVFPNITPDSYTVEVTMDSFKTVRRTGVAVSGGDRIGVPSLTPHSPPFTVSFDVCNCDGRHS